MDALFGREREQLVQAAAALSREHAPLEAVREWLLLFVNYLANKQIMAEILNSLGGRSERVRSHSLEILVDTLANLLDRALRRAEPSRRRSKPWIYCAPLRRGDLWHRRWMGV